MSSRCRKANLIPHTALFAIALGCSYSVWAKSPTALRADSYPDTWEVSALSSSEAVPSDLRLAMMDEMMKMDKMDKKNGMAPDAPMPDAGSSGSMQSPMTAPSGPDMMGRMRGVIQPQKGMSSMAPTAGLPGFPGASHLYHVGATGFFLDHTEHISLSTEQQTSLNRIKEKALLERTSSDRRIEDAEQELWTLTASDAPDAAKIEAKVRAVEKLRGDQRVAFIRAVGEAGKILTSDQHAALLGTKPPSGTKPMPMPAASKPTTMPGMPGMPRE